MFLVLEKQTFLANSLLIAINYSKSCDYIDYISIYIFLSFDSPKSNFEVIHHKKSLLMTLKQVNSHHCAPAFSKLFSPYPLCSALHKEHGPFQMPTMSCSFCQHYIYECYDNWMNLFLYTSDAYTSSEITFTWRKGLEASVDCPQESISLLQYDLVGQRLSMETFKSNTGKDPL